MKDKMKTYLTPLLLCIFFSCSTGKDETSEKSKVEKKELINNDSTSFSCQYDVSAKYYMDLNEKVNYLDSIKNPYMVQRADVNIYSCDAIEKKLERISCVIKQFQKANVPVHVGPTHNIPEKNRKELIDSVFIVDCIGDNEYFNEEERQYNYLNGKLLNATKNFYLILIAEEFGVGKSFVLLTVSTKTGNLIDKITLGGEFSDSQSVFGKLTDLEHFEIDTKEFGYDEQKDLMYFKNELTRKYQIDKTGTFKEIKKKDA